MISIAHLHNLVGSIYTCGYDGYVSEFDASDGSLSHKSSWRCSYEALNGISLVDDQRILATTGADGIARLWDLRNMNGKSAFQQNLHQEGSCKWSP
jgi:WD40 repeat protein